MNDNNMRQAVAQGPLFSGPFAIAAMAMLLVGSRAALTARAREPSASR